MNVIPFKPDDPVMAIHMAYSIVMCLNWGGWVHPGIANSVHRDLSTF
jgi:hypothetical protein